MVIKYIPALLSGTAAANGDAITNPAGFTHNGSECGFQQVDADKGVFGASTSFYGNGTSTWDEKTYAQWAAQFTENGNLNLWVKKDANGNITRADQYPLSKVFTVAEATQNLAFYGTDGNVLYSGGEVVLDANGFVVYTA